MPGAVSGSAEIEGWAARSLTHVGILNPAATAASQTYAILAGWAVREWGRGVESSKFRIGTAHVKGWAGAEARAWGVRDGESASAAAGGGGVAAVLPGTLPERGQLQHQQHFGLINDVEEQEAKNVQ